MRLTAAILIWAVALSPQARADEQFRPIASSGQWVVGEHRASMMAAPDMCLAFNEANGVAIKASTEGLELRVLNSAWALPAHVTGDIAVAIGEWTDSYSITWNDNTLISAVMAPEDLNVMLATMKKAPRMTVTVGKAKPMQVSLIGSNRALTAFQTCAGIKSAGDGNPDSNPFQ